VEAVKANDELVVALGVKSTYEHVEGTRMYALYFCYPADVYLLTRYPLGITEHTVDVV
jgi:hypothetical protein